MSIYRITEHPLFIDRACNCIPLANTLNILYRLFQKYVIASQEESEILKNYRYFIYSKEITPIALFLAFPLSAISLLFGAYLKGLILPKKK